MFARVLRAIRELVRRHAVAPTRRLAIVVAASAPVWLLSRGPAGYAVALTMTGVILLAVIIDAASLPHMEDMRVRRTLPPSIGAGDTVDATYEVETTLKRWLRVRVYDALPAKFLSRNRSSAEVEIVNGSTAQQVVAVTGLARGEAALGDIALNVRTRLGFVARNIRFSQDDRVIVAPSIAGLARFRWMAVHQRIAMAGFRTTRRRGEGSSFSRLRDYAVGDDPRHIDWKATARRGHPITREFTIEQSQTVFVLVDAGRSMTQLSGSLSRFEYALSSTMLLADIALTAGDRVGALVFDDEARALVPAQRGATALSALRSALMPVQPTLVEPDYANAFRVLAQRQRKRALVVLLTDVLDERTAKMLLAHLTRSGTHHLALVVALRNEAILAASNTVGARVSDMYLGAAASELVAERQTALQRMRDAGVVVLDVAPDAMAAAVINEYLEIKSRGAL